MAEPSISIAVIKRLPRYYRYLGDLLDNGITRISSKDLSRRMNVTASQIRQDLSNFGCFGQQGYGYHVEMLYDEIKKILGLDRLYRLVIIGAGHLGQALASYKNFERRGFLFIGLFDIDPGLVGQKVENVPIYPLDRLESFLAQNPVDIAVLTLPHQGASDVAKLIMASGVKGIWNFSHVDIPHAPDVKIENVHLTDSLMTLSYKLNEGDNVE